MTQPDKRQDLRRGTSAKDGRVGIKRTVKATSYPPTDLQNWVRKVSQRLAQTQDDAPVLNAKAR